MTKTQRPQGVYWACLSHSLLANEMLDKPLAYFRSLTREHSGLFRGPASLSRIFLRLSFGMKDIAGRSFLEKYYLSTPYRESQSMPLRAAFLAKRISLTHVSSKSGVSRHRVESGQ